MLQLLFSSLFHTLFVANILLGVTSRLSEVASSLVASGDFLRDLRAGLASLFRVQTNRLPDDNYRGGCGLFMMLALVMVVALALVAFRLVSLA